MAATVVRAQSPTSVRAGDSAIVRPDGAIEGFVGGTCAEASVRLYSLRAMETGEPLLLRILPGAAEGEPEAEEGSVTVKNPCLSGGALEVFLEPHLPAPTMRVVGSAPIAIALADLAGRVGYAVESGPAELARPSAGDAAVIVASHGHDEERVLTEALRSGVPYVALVASEVRGLAVRESLDVSERGARPPAHAGGTRDRRGDAGGDRARDPRGDRRPAAEGRGRAGRRGPGPTGIEAAPVESPVPVPAEPAPVVLSTETAIDPVCGMEVAVSEASIQLERDGEIHYFCSEGCRDTFSAQGVPDGAAH